MGALKGIVHNRRHPYYNAVMAERNLSYPSTFVGREEDQRRILELLAMPDCRLLTLVGPGGIGKTRLALQLLEQVQDDYEHGASFVPLQPVGTADHLVTTLAEAVELSLSGQEAPRRQLFNYLRNKEMLLLLDNFEQLLEAASLLSDLLREAPEIQMLVTSREVLNLQEEWLYPVPGLPVPPSAQVGDAQSYGAVQLFLARARRVRPDFSLENEEAGVVRICQLVQGMPLAIELAASWLKTLRCAAIAAEIQQSIDFLATNLRNVPDRHRSMQAVFNHSWKLLSAAERDVFQRLSVFRGGFRRAAAATVAGATLPILSALVDKSLIARRESGRYDIHELLRQYGAEKLAASPEALTEAHEQHCAYYADFMQQRVDSVNNRQQIEASAEITAELDNVRVAWAWAVKKASVEQIHQICSTYFYFCQIQSRFLEGADALEAAVVALQELPASEEREQTLARLLNHQGWLRIRLGEFDRAEAQLSRSRDLFARLDQPPPPYMGGDSAVPLGIVRLIRGDHEQAEALGEEARCRAAVADDKQNLAFAHYLLTSTKSAQGQYGSAHDHANQACAMARAAGNRWFLPYPLNEWGNVARARGDYKAARRHFQASYSLKKEFSDPEGMAVALNHLGDIAILQSEEERAAELYAESLAIYQEINDRGGRAKSLQGLGRLAWVRQDYEAARKRLARALDVAYEIEFWPLVFSLLLDSGELLLQTNRSGLGFELLALVQRHPHSDHETTARADRLLARWQEKVGNAPFGDGKAHKAPFQGKELDLETAVGQLQTALAEPIPARTPAQTLEQPLVEPLTDRELQVLDLMAQGYTNREIAEELVIALGTVKWYASQIYGKLDVSNRTEAANRAREIGLLP